MSFLKKTGIMVLLLSVIIPASILLAKSPDYKELNIKYISRFNEDRVAFQHIEKFTAPLKDDSVECLLIIKKSKMYLIKDGFDPMELVKNRRTLAEMQRQLIPDQDFWENKINGKPDFIKVTDRRVELLRNQDEKFVSEKFGTFYSQVKIAFLNRHKAIFRQLMVNRKDSDFKVDRGRIVSVDSINRDPNIKTKYYLRASAKSNDGKVYFAEDADGDGITETFTVSILDGFTWGLKSGANTIFIYKNRSKDIQDIIGNLAKEAYYGTPEEEKQIIDSFPKDEAVVDMINELVPDEKFYK